MRLRLSLLLAAAATVLALTPPETGTARGLQFAQYSRPVTSSPSYNPTVSAPPVYNPAPQQIAPPIYKTPTYTQPTYYPTNSYPSRYYGN
jgi:hypothetical protein